MNKEPNCIFCKIIAKEITAEIVYEDKDFLAFMDIKPRSPGHIQVIPKDHYRWVWDVPNCGEYFEVAKKMALVLKKTFDTDKVYSAIEGNEVPHAHIWIWPDNKIPGDKMDLKGNAEKIRKELN